MTILENLKIPTLNPQRVPIKTLIEQLQPTSQNKRLIETHVASIYLVSLLNEQTIHFRAYKDDEYSYQSIYVLQVTLKKDDQLTDLSTQLHSAFPEPTILLYVHGNKEWISVAPKRINKVDQTKTVLEDVVVQEIKNSFNQYLNLTSYSSINLKEYYLQIVKLIYKLGVYSLINVFPTVDLDYKPIIKEYQKIQTNIINLKEQYKKVTMKAEKLQIDDDIYDEEMKQKKLLRTLKGECIE